MALRQVACKPSKRQERGRCQASRAGMLSPSLQGQLHNLASMATDACYRGPACFQHRRGRQGNCKLGRLGPGDVTADVAFTELQCSTCCSAFHISQAQQTQNGTWEAGALQPPCHQSSSCACLLAASTAGRPKTRLQDTHLPRFVTSEVRCLLGRHHHDTRLMLVSRTKSSKWYQAQGCYTTGVAGNKHSVRPVAH